MILRASNFRRVCGVLLRPPLWVFVAAVVFVGADVAFAIDGNYASPYASQYDARSTSATIPIGTWLGLLLLVVNLATAVVVTLRHRRRANAA